MALAKLEALAIKHECAASLQSRESFRENGLSITEERAWFHRGEEGKARTT